MEAIHTQGGPATPSQDVAARESRLYSLSREFLGGSRLIKHRMSSPMEVHAAILAGIPYASLIFLLTTFEALHERDVVNVLGISARTLRRQKDNPKKSMPAALASKTWLFAETLANASDVFGSKDSAQEWMARPALGLDRQRPIDLLQTVQGAEVVNDFLMRLDYGVYT
jgi:putative toxin-antitoxin system antitoxin component (TIGR02293 family)